MKRAQEGVKVWYFKSDQNYVPYDKSLQDRLNDWDYNRDKTIYFFIGKTQYEIVRLGNDKFIQYQVGLTDEQKKKRYRYVMFQLENDTRNDKPKTLEEELNNISINQNLETITSLNRDNQNFNNPQIDPIQTDQKEHYQMNITSSHDLLRLKIKKRIANLVFIYLDKNYIYRTEENLKNESNATLLTSNYGTSEEYSGIILTTETFESKELILYTDSHLSYQMVLNNLEFNISKIEHFGYDLNPDITLTDDDIKNFESLYSIFKTKDVNTTMTVLSIITYIIGGNMNINTLSHWMDEAIDKMIRINRFPDIINIQFGRLDEKTLPIMARWKKQYKDLEVIDIHLSPDDLVTYYSNDIKNILSKLDKNILQWSKKYLILKDPNEYFQNKFLGANRIVLQIGNWVNPKKTPQELKSHSLNNLVRITNVSDSIRHRLEYLNNMNQTLKEQNCPSVLVSNDEDPYILTVIEPFSKAIEYLSSDRYLTPEEHKRNLEQEKKIKSDSLGIISKSRLENILKEDPEYANFYYSLKSLERPLKTAKARDFIKPDTKEYYNLSENQVTIQLNLDMEENKKVLNERGNEILARILELIHMGRIKGTIKDYIKNRSRSGPWYCDKSSIYYNPKDEAEIRLDALNNYTIIGTLVDSSDKGLNNGEIETSVILFLYPHWCYTKSESLYLLQ